MRARNPAAAARTAVLVLVVCAVVLLVFSLFGPAAGGAGGVIGAWITAGVRVCLAAGYAVSSPQQLGRRGG